MKLTMPRLEFSFLRSKVARRIFSLFVLCALIPLCLLAILSLNQVKAQLNMHADRLLHQDSKAAAMTVFERLSFLDTDLDIVISNLGAEYPGNLEFAVRNLGGRLSERFKSLALVASDDRIVDSFGPMPLLPELKKKDRLHLGLGHPLFAVRSNSQGEAKAFIAKATHQTHTIPQILLGEIQPNYLWGDEGLQDSTAELFAFGEDGELLYSSLEEKHPQRELENARQRESQSGRFEWNDGKNRYLASYWTLFLRPTFLNSVILVYSEKKDQVLAPLYGFSRTFVLVVLLSFWIIALLSLTQIRRCMIPIEQLRDATQKIKKKDFTGRVRIDSKDEFQELGISFNDMTESLENHLKVMHTINGIGVSLSAEKDDQRLLEIILSGSRSVVNADGAAIYLAQEDMKLELAVMHVCSLDLWIEGSNKHSPYAFDVLESSAEALVRRGITVHIEDIYAVADFEFKGLKSFDIKAGYRSKSLLSVPLKNHEDETIGLLLLINAIDRQSGTITRFSSEDQRLTESLASQAAVAITKNRLVQEFKQLFEGLTELIGTAIDEKSAYTGEHCKRVPALALMLAEAASKSSAGPFRDFSLSPEEEYELKIAALLHDCGKVVTPVHIVDKSKKLESIIDRIQLIETRFEISKHQKHIELLHEAMRSSGHAEEALSGIYEEMRRYSQKLDEALEFLRKCNSGTEFMPEALQERIRNIALKYSWKRSTGERESCLTANEVENLTIPYGTLNRDERNIIDQHIVFTIKMLNSLPYPKRLRNVPVHAAAHHERMDGKGYPLGLTGDEISLQGRILALADIFEALTAADRPYKKVKTLSEALEILRTMKENGQIDPDLFDLFMSEKIYLRYARQFLTADQMDLMEQAVTAS